MNVCGVAECFGAAAGRATLLQNRLQMLTAFNTRGTP